MKVKNKARWIIKHIGLGLLLVGFVLLVLQIFGYLPFPYAAIVCLISIVLQVIGFNEPIWFLIEKEE